MLHGQCHEAPLRRLFYLNGNSHRPARYSAAPFPALLRFRHCFQFHPALHDGFQSLLRVVQLF